MQRIILSLLLLLMSVTLVHAIAEKPNIVLILADDLGWHQLGCYGSDFYETPTLDRMAAEGMRFTSAYAAAAVCSPSRASIMTGKYPARLHLTDYIPGQSPQNKPLKTPAWTRQLPLKEVTLAECLKAAGYATGHFGKWHLNRNKNYKPGRPGDPGSQGFDDVLTTHKFDSGPPSPFEEDWLHVRQITERAIEFIRANRNRPFFAYVSHNSIHRPEKARPELIQRFADKPNADNDEMYGHNNSRQAAMLYTLDASIDRIMKTLRELDLEQNTLLIFFSDNGHLGPKDSRPLRGSKGDLYEGGTRVPMIVRWPGVTPAGTVSDELVCSVDFLPTFVAFAGGGPLPEDVDGMDLSTLFRHAGARLSRDRLYFHFPHYHSLGIAPMGAMRQGRYKLIEWYEKSLTGKPGAFELYDLETDRAERHDLAAAKPELLEKLKADFAAWRKKVGAQEMELK